MSRSKKSNAALSASASNNNTTTPPAVNGTGTTGAQQPPISAFISKVYALVEDERNCNIISWSPNGQYFLIHNEFAFASRLMPRHFRHTNFSSFVRQLNFYGFHKRSAPNEPTVFDHPYFQRGRLDLLPLIRRKTSAPSGERADKYADDLSELGRSVQDLKQRYNDLFHIQQQILYVFSRYVRGSNPNEIPTLEDVENAVRRSNGPAGLTPRLLMPHIETDLGDWSKQSKSLSFAQQPFSPLPASPLPMISQPTSNSNSTAIMPYIPMANPPSPLTPGSNHASYNASVANNYDHWMTPIGNPQSSRFQSSSAIPLGDFNSSSLSPLLGSSLPDSINADMLDFSDVPPLDAPIFKDNEVDAAKAD